MKMIQLICQWH